MTLKLTKKFVKTAVLFISCAVVVTSCSAYSPEELIKPPQLNADKKEIKSAIDNFKPESARDYLVQYFPDNSKSSFIVKDLDQDDQNEILYFYKEDMSQLCSLMILKKTGGVWDKAYSKTFKNFEPGRVDIQDLDNNSTREILIDGYRYQISDDTYGTNNKIFTVIYYDKGKFSDAGEVPHMVMAEDFLDDDKLRDITFLKFVNDSKLPNLIIYNFDKNRFLKLIGRTVPEVYKPFEIKIGKITSDKDAIFINYVNEKNSGNTKIIFYNNIKNTFTSSKDEIGIDLDSMVLNVKAEDIDLDRIIEVGYKYKAPNYSVPVNDDSSCGLIDGYFAVKNGKLNLKKEIYNDYNFKFSIEFPQTFKGRYALSVSKDLADTNINFVTASGIEYPLFTISRIDRYKWNKDSLKAEYENYQLLFETEDYVISGVVYDFSGEVPVSERETYADMRDKVLVLSNIVNNKNYTGVD